MPRVTPVPYEKMDPEIQEIVKASDEALGGSEWIQYFCHRHPAELYKDFVKFYYSRIMTDGNGLSVSPRHLAPPDHFPRGFAGGCDPSSPDRPAALA